MRALRFIGIGAAAVIGALAIAGPAAAAEEGTPFPRDEFAVQLRVDADGSVYWLLPLRFTDAFPAPIVDWVGSWERVGGTWGTPDAAVAARAGVQECRAAAGTLETASEDDGCWQASGLDYSAWSAAAAGAEDAEDIVLRIPFEQYGEGVHPLFVATVRPLAGYDAEPYRSPGGTAGPVYRATVHLPPISTVDPSVPGPAWEDVAAGGGLFEEAVSSAPAGGWFTAPSGYNALAYPWEADFAPAHIAATVGLTLVLGVLVLLPTALLEQTLAANRGRIAGWLVALLPGRTAETDAASRRRPFEIAGWWAIPALLVAAVLTAFADPETGFGIEALRTVLSALVALVAFNLVGAVIARTLGRRWSGPERPRITVQPLFLVLLLVCALFARFGGVEPAIVIGALVGVEHARALRPRLRGAEALVLAGYALALGIVAWFLYGAASFAEPVLGVWLGEVLSILTIASIASLPVTLLPLSSFDGGALWSLGRGSRWYAWLPAYIAALAAFSLILLPLPQAWEYTDESLIVWVCVFAAYCLVAVGVWAAFRYLPAKGRPADRQPADSGGG